MHIKITIITLISTIRVNTYSIKKSGQQKTTEDQPCGRIIFRSSVHVLSPNAYEVSCRIRTMRVARPYVKGFTPSDTGHHSVGSPAPYGFSEQRMIQFLRQLYAWMFIL